MFLTITAERSSWGDLSKGSFHALSAHENAALKAGTRRRVVRAELPGQRFDVRSVRCLVLRTCRVQLFPGR